MLKNLTTESRNPASEGIDALSALQIVRLMNAEDAGVAAAVGKQAEPIAAAIELIAERFRRGGRLIYLGAGTSGRLGVLDATECPPTFNAPPGQVLGLIAGGNAALTQAVEGAEDRPELAVEDLQRVNLSSADVVVGIASSGRTPYVIAGLQFARDIGAGTVALSCNADSSVGNAAEIAIAPIVGPEVLSGSTRLKAGTATKMVLNMLTTGAMVLIGKTYGNLMVDLRATNTKLRDRAQRIASQLTGLDAEEARQLLTACDGELKTAIVAHRRGISAPEARELLEQSGGQLRRALEPSEQIATCDSTHHSPRTTHQLVLGIDGGGTGTVALLATKRPGESEIRGRGLAGPANPQVIGFPAAVATLELAVRRAFADAGLPPLPVEAACIALAGAGRPSDREQLERWGRSARIASHLVQVHDALPVLMAGTPQGIGVALIAGTGSLAFGRNAAGQTARSGGWGYLFGDEGSGYWIAVEALRAVGAASDGRGPPTTLQELLLAALDIADPQDLVPAIYASGRGRAELASLARVVHQTAEAGDPLAVAILQRAAAELARMTAAVAERLGFRGTAFPLALAGGVLVECGLLRTALEASLRQQALEPLLSLVPEPATGAVHLARAAAQAQCK